MTKVTKPRVKVLATGNELITKQMAANAGELLPKHLADVESMLFVHEGECIFKMNGEDHSLKPGDAIVVPARTKHQIQAKTDFKAIHFMSKDIEFEFFK